MQSSDDFTAIILAAGSSTRMGSPKQLLQFRSRCLLDHAVRAAVDAGLPVAVVLGDNADRIQSHAASLGRTSVIINKDYHHGMSTSLVCGVRSVRTPGMAYVFMLADQPLVSGDLLKSMIEMFRQKRADILYPEFAGKRGNPVIIAASLRRRLLEAKGDKGARFLFAENTLKKVAYPAPDLSVLTDIDTPEDYRRLLEGAE